MSRRILSLILLFVLVLGTVSLTASPVTAAPTNTAVKSAPNADLLPLDTAFYLDFRSADLDGTLAFVGDVFQKVTGEALPPIFTSMDQGLTQTLGRPASFEKDIQPWLGEHVTVALRMTDKQLATLNAPSAQPNFAATSPEYMIIVSVKDDAAAAKFVKDVVAKVPPKQIKTRTDSVNGNKATIYDQPGTCGTNCVSVVQTKGFLALGSTTTVNEMLTSLKAKKPRFGSDPTFNKLVGALAPDSLMTMYINPRFYSYALAISLFGRRAATSFATPIGPKPTPQPDPTVMLRSILGAIKGQAFAIRRNDKALVLDIVQSIDPTVLQKVYTDLGYPPDLVAKLLPQKIDGKLINQIPDKATAVILSRGLSNLYDGATAGLKAGSTQNSPQAKQFDEITKQLGQAEGALKVFFDLDLKADILSWMDGDFAIYMVYNPNSVLAKVGSSPWPFDHTILIDTSDVAKTKSFLTKLNAGLEKNTKIKAVSAGTDLYRITIPAGQTNGSSASVEIAYGLVGNTFLVTTGSGLDAAVAAIKGDGTITNNPQWKGAQAAAIQPSSQFWFANLGNVSTILKKTIPAHNMDNVDTQRALRFLDLFDSAMISAGASQPDGTNVATLQLIMK
ncbi:MAG: DUF3352 domain-containing protein [Chloroflexota bacterium]